MHQRGFVLIGVVMFVLALTILGLSLFSLSGYEAEFLEHSHDATQAFYDATGGIDRARYMLVTRRRLDAVKDALDYDGPDGVIYARARYQDTPWDSSGLLTWSDDKVIELRVLAERHGVRSMIESNFRETTPEDPYKHLVTTTSALSFFDPVYGPDVDNLRNTYLDGSAWLGSRDSSTWHVVTIGQLARPVQFDGMPTPDLGATYWNPRKTLAVAAGNTINVLPVDDFVCDLTRGLDGEISYYYTGPSITHAFLRPEIHVKGYAVWLCEGGINFSYGPIVRRASGSPNACLVIVARDPPLLAGRANTSIWFFGGLDSPDGVPIILVGSKDVLIEQVDQGANKGTTLNYLSIFSGGLVRLIGPRSLDGTHFIHQPGDANDLPGGLIDGLNGAGALPNPPGGQLDQLTRVSGTWRQVTESNPY